MEANDQILSKLRKLMALYEGAKKIDSEEEANNAAAKIQNLLTKYNLSMSDISEDAAQKPEDLIKSEVSSSYDKNIGGYWRFDLMYTICKWNFCKCFLYGKREDKRMIIFGEEQNLTTVKWMYSMLCTTFVKLGKAKHKVYAKQMESNGMKPMSWDKYLRNYLPGCAKGLDWKLSNESLKMKKESEEMSTKITALVVQKSDAIKKHMEDRYHSEKKKVNMPPRTSATAYSEGVKDGQKVNLFKPINESRREEFNKVKILK